MVARRAHNPEAVGSNPAPATKKSHPRQNASGLLISTYPSDCNGFGDLPPVQVSSVRCTQIALKPVYVQLRLDIKNKIPIIISDPSTFQNFFPYKTVNLQKYIMA